MCKKVCCPANFALLAGFFGIGATIRIGGEMLCFPYAGFFSVSPIFPSKGQSVVMQLEPICHQGGSIKTTCRSYKNNRWSFESETVVLHKQRSKLCLKFFAYSNPPLDSETTGIRVFFSLLNKAYSISI